MHAAEITRQTSLLGELSGWEVVACWEVEIKMLCILLYW